MKEFKREQVRNIALVGHGGSGKTSLAEAILFSAKTIDRLGKVDDGTSTMDSDPEELKRTISISTSVHHCPWKDHKITLLDTPGDANFLSESFNAIRVVEAAVIVIDAIDAVKVQTEMLWESITQMSLPRVLFVNKIDRERADFHSTIQTAEKALGTRLVLLQIPIGAEAAFSGIVDLVHGKALKYKNDLSGEFRAGEIPEELKEEAESLREKLIESAAESNDELLEKYLDGATLSEEEIYQGLREGILSGAITPVLCGAALVNIGAQPLLNQIVELLPSPLDRGEEVGSHPMTQAEEKRTVSESDPFSALVFKTVADPFAGRLSIFRVFSGSLKADASFYNVTKDSRERFGQIFQLEGKKQSSLGTALPGDIVAVAKLKNTATGDTLTDEANPILYTLPPYPNPLISFAIRPKATGDEDKVASSLTRLMEEDLTLKTHREEQTKEFILSGMGQVHIEVTVEKLKRKFGVEVTLDTPKVPYKETIKTKSKAQGKYKKQSGGRGQYGDTWLEIEPLPRGSGFEFADKIVGGVIPKQYIPAVEKGIAETMVAGAYAGYPVVDLRVTLYDGSFHDVDSSEMAFKIAGSMGFKKAFMDAKPYLIEPIMNMEIAVPEDSMGDIIGDLNSRRGRIMGVDPKGGAQVIQAQTPMAEVLRYAPDLRSRTSGRGTFTMSFSHYEEVPANIAEKIVAAKEQPDKEK